MNKRLYTTAVLAAITTAGAAVGLLVPHTQGQTPVGTPPYMSTTFVQPSINVSYPTINWTRGQFVHEFTLMRAAGIDSVIVQWSVDQDANQAYYPATQGWFPQVGNMVGNILDAARDVGMKNVWLGLCNTFNWQAHAGDSVWLNNQQYDDQVTADQLWTLYGNRIHGWYISNEVDDSLLSTPADVAPMTTFFSGLATYLHTNDGGLPVMESPRYSSLTQSPTQFASSVQVVLGTLDVINVQDGGGSGYIFASDIKNWFTALNVNHGTTQIWQDADMFAPSPGGPMQPQQLMGDLQATWGLVSGYSGFSFPTLMDPAVVGAAAFQAYENYWRHGQFGR